MTPDSKVQRLRRLQEEAKQGGGAKAIEAQHGKAK